MFIAALFIIGKIWKQPKSPKDEWLRKMVCVCVCVCVCTYTVEYCYGSCYLLAKSCPTLQLHAL